MKSLFAVFMLLSVSAVLVCCGSTTQGTTPVSTNMTAGTWVITIVNGVGVGKSNIITTTVAPNGTPVPATSGNTSCSTDSYQNEPPYQSVVGPACFNALGGGSDNQVGTLSQSAPGEPLNLMLGVPANPVTSGSAFNLLYMEVIADGTEGIWQIDGTGTISNGTASGTWVCDASTPLCSGISGTFSATQQ
jgi:hypothetical protein